MQEVKTNLKIDNSAITVADIKALFSIMDRTAGQKVNKEIESLNTIKQLDLTNT